ncbi:MAG TPA: Flp pilus assembly protein CpaB [Chloroflexia bacterium]|nr:Flp pilus assembly protein CpaB [Chloroflexia bacterium]
MRQRGLMLMLAGMFAAVVAGLLVFALSNSQVQRTPVLTPVAVVPTATAVPTEEVLLAAKDIPLRHVVAATDVVTRDYPLGLAPIDAFHIITDVLSTTSTSPVFAGEILVKRQFNAAGERTGASVVIPPGKLLVAFPASDMLESTGAVQPGDKVDILLTLPVSGTTVLNSSDAVSQQQQGAKEQVSQATMQNVEVYSEGVWTPQGPAATGGQGGANNGGNATEVKVITFIVDHQEALILKYVKDSGGTIDLAVRSLAEKDPVNTDPVSLDYLVDLYHFVTLKGR